MSKTLIITGASKGIGLATAKRFVDEGYRVINVSRSSSSDGRIEQVSLDLGAADWNADLVDTLVDAAKTSSELVLIHNAALLRKDATDDLDNDSLRQVLELNVVAVSRLNQLLLPHMKQGSALLYVGSTLGEKAVANSCSYVVSKHALIGLMRATVQDLAGKGIHSCCVCPGFTNTEMLRDHVGQNQEILESLASGVTQGRLIEPSEIADTLWFCSQSAVINGAVIHANLGQVES